MNLVVRPVEIFLQASDNRVMFSNTFRWFHTLIHRPIQVFWICVVLALIGIVLDGTAFQLWSLKRDHKVMTARIKDANLRSKQLGFRIQRAQEPEFIERAARDQFDLVKEGDLIFIFSDDVSETTEKTTGT
jgi:cell division protein FtsB